MKKLIYGCVVLLAISCTSAPEKHSTVAEIEQEIGKGYAQILQQPFNYYPDSTIITDTLFNLKTKKSYIIKLRCKHYYHTSVARVSHRWDVFLYPKTGEIIATFQN